MATKVDLVCEQGADLCFVVNYRRGETDIPVDVAGGLARLQARSSLHAKDPFLDIDSGGKGGITIEAAVGRFIVFVSAAATTTYSPTREAIYDLEFVDVTGKTSRVIEGRFRVIPQVTR